MLFEGGPGSDSLEAPCAIFGSLFTSWLLGAQGVFQFVNKKLSTVSSFMCLFLVTASWKVDA
jgi:hypothetical protein